MIEIQDKGTIKNHSVRMKGQIGKLCFKAEPVWYVGIAVTQPAFQGRAHHEDQKANISISSTLRF